MGRNYNDGMLLEGIFAAVTTCFYPDGRPYWRKLEANMERYSRTAMSGMVLLGSTGEAVMLSDEESREALRVARICGGSREGSVGGGGARKRIETLRLADYAAELQYDAVLVRTPHYYRKQMRNREMLTYYQAVADRSPLPVLLYSVPSCTAYDLPVEVVAELAMHPNIVGMKDSSGNVERIARAGASHALSQEADGPGHHRLCRSYIENAAPPPTTDEERADFRSRGAAHFGSHGSCSGAPSASAQDAYPGSGFPAALRFCPDALSLAGSRSYRWSAGARNALLRRPAVRCIRPGRKRIAVLAAEKQQRIARAGIEIAGKMGIPGVKYALDVNGYYGGRPRMPLLPLTGDEQRGR